MRSSLLTGTAVAVLVAASSAQADWSWKSALPWSSSYAEATTPAANSERWDWGFRNTNTGPQNAAGPAPAVAFAQANAFTQWGGGAGAGNAAGGGSYGQGDGFTGAASTLAMTSIMVAPDASVIRLTGASLRSGGGHLEMGAFVYRGDPAYFDGPGAGRSIAELVLLGVVAQSDVIFRRADADISTAFTDLVFPVPLDLRDDRALIVVAAWGQGATIPGPGGVAMLVAGVAGFPRRRRG